VILLANRNGGIFARSERAILAQLAPDAAQASEPPAPAPPAPALAAALGTYANGPDTLRLARRADGSLRYRYRAEDHAASYDAASGTFTVLDAQGRATQEFLLVRGTVTGAWYLHDGLSAFARVGRAPSRGR
jgi:hypothetical protein